LKAGVEMPMPTLPEFVLKMLVPLNDHCAAVFVEIISGRNNAAMLLMAWQKVKLRFMWGVLRSCTPWEKLSNGQEQHHAACYI
jgi:hypothetical protein